MIEKIQKLFNEGKKLIFVVLIILPTISYDSFSQVSDISFEQIFIDQGLSQSIVKSILQDKRGFMYFGTEDGLNIFDGYSFKVIRKTDDVNSLSYNDITSIYEDVNERIWLGTFNSGVNIYIPEEKRYIHLNHDPNDTNSLSNDNINAVVQDKSGNVWIGTDKGLNLIFSLPSNPNVFIIERGITGTDKRKYLTQDRILTLMVDSENHLWVGTDNGLKKIKFNEDYNLFSVNEFETSILEHGSISDKTIRTIFEDSRGNIWIGTENGLNKIKYEERKKKNPLLKKFFNDLSFAHSLVHNSVYAITEDFSGMIWIGTNGGGISIYDYRKEKFSSYQNDPLDKRSLSNNEIRYLYCDRSGIIWIGTYGGGINKVARGTGQFFHYKHRANDPNSLSHAIVWSFYEENENVLWIGTHNGLDRLDKTTNTFHHYKNIPGKNSISNNIVRVLSPGKNGKILIGTNGGGINEFDPANGTFKVFKNDPFDTNSLKLDQIRAIYQDNEGIIWIGTYGGGMDRFDPYNNKFTHYFYNPKDSQSLSQNYVRVIFEDSKGFLWIGTEGGGLNRFDKKSGKFKRYRYNPKDRTGINSDYIFSIFEDSAGYLWLGTYGGGVNKFDPKTEESKTITTNEGLPSNSVYGVIKDKLGNIWLSTSNGLGKIDPLTEDVKIYNIKDGLQDNEFNGGSYYITRKGELLFGGINGFNAFDPSKISDNRYIPPVVLTSFKKFNEEVIFTQLLTSIKEIVLDHSDNIFSFEFAALDYRAPEKNLYSYKMEGIDKDWVIVSAEKRFASYTTLSPGEYNFFVKASNSDGLWNESGIKIKVKIVPPFWQRWWFISFIFLLIFGTGYFLYLRRLRILRMKVELKTAHDAQLSIMPQTNPVYKNIEVSGVCVPANEVGGDFFDYFWLNKEKTKFGVMIGDVSGKAMKAAITAIMTSGMIISELNRSRSISTILDNVNSLLIGKIEKRMFVAVCICIIDLDEMTLTFGNAGMNKPILLTNRNAIFLESEGIRLPLGVKENLNYEEKKYKIIRGDKVIFTTDGVNEAQNSVRELFGLDRLSNFLLSIDNNNLSAMDLKESITKEVLKFTRKNNSSDDMTVLVIKIK